MAANGERALVDGCEGRFDVVATWARKSEVILKYDGAFREPKT